MYGNEQISPNRNVTLWDSTYTAKAQRWSYVYTNGVYKIVSDLKDSQGQTYSLNLYRAGPYWVPDNEGKCDVYYDIASNNRDSSLMLYMMSTSPTQFYVQLTNHAYWQLFTGYNPASNGCQVMWVKTSAGTVPSRNFHWIRGV